MSSSCCSVFPSERTTPFKWNYLTFSVEAIGSLVGDFSSVKPTAASVESNASLSPSILGAKANQNLKKTTRGFVVNAKEGADMLDGITGKFRINDVYAKVLFDSEANQSFIDCELRKLLNEPLVKLDKPYPVESTNDDLVKMKDVLVNCKITFFNT
ncbi:hypothetical protein E3N88_38042 [Mikania micrantha]|uniref:Uncharacterized protein n=1 Tax=Mikania micrantha TaxID=192012 RepID=A0A5N6LTM3_9ASTR|nr:hypothetical protein E3N88_38042 [Mikania micrantha]